MKGAEIYILQTHIVNLGRAFRYNDFYLFIKEEEEEKEKEKEEEGVKTFVLGLVKSAHVALGRRVQESAALSEHSIIKSL